MDLNKRHHLPLPSLMTVLITLAIGLGVGYLGPFGSFQMPLGQRLLYWVILIGVGHAIFSLTERFCQNWLANKNLNVYLKLVITSVIGAVFLSFFVDWTSQLFFDSSLRFPQSLQFYYPKVLILSLILNVFGHLLEQARNAKTATTTNPPKDNRFIQRLPHQLGTELICFSMEDHYLKVYTERGDHMMLLRMKDALVELEHYPGIQVHRSWWVALDAIKQVKKQTRKATLILHNDMEVPVSQKYLPQLKQHGLLS
ncbi:LytTR family DNA-binding domain-containing protein [Marinicella meishanensis]|uniref:LytTR family DNA-binding domain-containing protein n=1 Tax=Marinicella meishanensis TaxID=2873263 RepID=UPI001CC12FA3|nr:LytTR family DNA-binding domain-containing protein [Marinicella sp. NBU2979]